MYIMVKKMNIKFLKIFFLIIILLFLITKFFKNKIFIENYKNHNLKIDILNNNKNYILEIKLNGGLCNKLFCLFTACDIATKKNIKLLEPIFGWKKKIFFSDIYDINYFNDKMKGFNNGKIIMISRKKRNEYKVIKNNIDLWKYSQNILKKQRKENMLKNNCMNILVLKSLKLNNSNLKISRKYESSNINALHIRIESDWVKYSKNKNKMNDESFIVNLDELINIYKKKWRNEDIFFTTGENQIEIKNKFNEKNINSSFIFDPDLEYEINAAINFDLCSKAKRFIGISKSTFSNLITLNRSLNKKNESYIYNFKNTIEKRIDKGLHCEPYKSINNQVNFY